MNKPIPSKYLQKHFDNKPDKIRQYFISADDTIVMTHHEKHLKERLEMTFSLLCEQYSNEQVVNALKKRFNISRSQAYYDIRNAMDVFGDVTQHKKTASKYILAEMAMKNYQLAQGKNDLDAMNKAVSNLIKIHGVDRDEIDLPDPTKIQPPVQVLQISLDFISSSFSHLIDDTAREELNKVINRINEIIEKSPVKNYLDKINVIQDAEFSEVSDES